MAMATVRTLEQNENLLKAFGNFPFAYICNQIYHEFRWDPFPCLPYKRTTARSFSQDKLQRLSWSWRMCQKAGSVSVFWAYQTLQHYRNSCYWHLLEKRNALRHLLPWRLVCQGERHWRGVLGHPPLPSLHHMCLGYAHGLSLKCKGYEALEMWGL